MRFIIQLLDLRMTEPHSFGWFHIMFILIAIGATIVLCKYFKDCDDKIYRRITFILWIIFISLELYKEFNFTFTYDEATQSVHSAYPWYIFPFQFCSSPFYVLPFIAFLKDGKVRNSCISFMATFSLFAGITVFVYPEQVFISTIGINIQTMVHHGSQIVFGIYSFVHFRKQFDYKFALSGIFTFMALCSVAILLDELYVAFGGTDTFNMYFISRHYPCTLPILSTIYEKVPYLVFLPIYVIGFGICAYITYLAQKGIYILISKRGC